MKIPAYEILSDKSRSVRIKLNLSEFSDFQDETLKNKSCENNLWK